MGDVLELVLYTEVTIMKVDLRHQVFVWGRLYYTDYLAGGGIIIYPLSPTQMNIPDNYKQDFLL